jgi:hypothetical protein
MHSRKVVRDELQAYLSQLETQRGLYLEAGMIKTIDNALDRAAEILGEEVPSLITPEAVAYGQSVSADSAAMVVTGVVARLQDSPRPARVWSPDMPGPRRSW